MAVDRCRFAAFKTYLEPGFILVKTMRALGGLEKRGWNELRRRIDRLST